MTTALEGSKDTTSRPGRSLPQGKDPIPIVQEAGWAPGPVSTGVENIAPTGIRSPDHPARSQSLYRLSYQVHVRWKRLRIISSWIQVCALNSGICPSLRKNRLDLSLRYFFLLWSMYFLLLVLREKLEVDIQYNLDKGWNYCAATLNITPDQIMPSKLYRYKYWHTNVTSNVSHASTCSHLRNYGN